MKRRKQIRRTLRRPFETGGFILIGSLIPLLPRRVVTGLARLAGLIAVLLPLRERRIGLANLDAVFADAMDRRQKRAILRSSLSTFCLTMLDVFWFSRNPEKLMRKYVEFEQGPLMDVFFQNKPAICISAHMGSWEILGQASALMGIDLASVAAPIKNKTADRTLVRLRESTGQTIVPRKGALRILIARFRKNGKAAFVLDQNTSEKEGGILVDFLGLPMRVSPAPAALAYRTGTPILLGFCLPEPGGRYRIYLTEQIDPPPYDAAADQAATVLHLTQRILDGVSAEIRKHPQYWLWSYRHWRKMPGIECPPNYPRY